MKGRNPLLLVALLASAVAETDQSVMNRHMSVLTRISRVPLGIVNEVANHRRLSQIDVDTWDDDGMDTSCDYSKDSNSLACTMMNDEDEYEVQEDCKFSDDNFTMTCDVCSGTLTSDNSVRFCYTVSCDFSSLLSDPDTEDELSVTAEVGEAACTCVSANINGEGCDYCGICELDDDGLAAQEETMLFSSLALQCPHTELVLSACDVPDLKSSEDGTELTGAKRGDIRPGEDNGTVRTASTGTVLVLAVAGCIGATLLYAFVVFGNKKAKVRTNPLFVGRVLGDGAEML